jgi:hypothetical protein
LRVRVEGWRLVFGLLEVRVLMKAKATARVRARAGAKARARVRVSGRTGACCPQTARVWARVRVS